MGTPWSAVPLPATGIGYFALRVGLLKAWKTLNPARVPRAIEKIAATVVPRVLTDAGPPVAAWLNETKLKAPGTSAQNDASIITIAGGELLIREASMANGTTRKAPTAPL
jgi:hypothetical protein